MILGNRLFFIFIFSYRLIFSRYGTSRRTLIRRPTNLLCPLYASPNDDIMKLSATVIDSESIRLAEWEKRKRKEIVCKSMPKSQKWYKEKQQHVSPNQKRIYNEYWPIYGVNLKYGNNVVPQQLFPNITVSDLTPVCLDIGFGLGDSIIGMSQQNKEKIYLGCEIHKAGICSVLGNISSLGIDNVRVIKADVTLLLGTYLKDRCLDEVCIFFPDPWPNIERDGERRVVRKDIIDLVSRCMRPGGRLYIATDVPEYADHVRSIMKESIGW
mmetsp:Transcript_1582/g.1719  ORF Transcript_1582/g.1719 Transcript_1582/m.1719 type:complete len:269 (-) Transcript_1582:5-811(-)